jgi:hypothetical protein
MGLQLRKEKGTEKRKGDRKEKGTGTFIVDVFLFLV